MTRGCPRPKAALIAAVVLLFAPAGLLAQSAEPRFEMSAGGVFVGGYSLGSQDANLVQNQTGGGSYVLFTSETDVDSAFGLDARIGVSLSRMFVVEGGILMTRPRMSTRLRSDVESAPDTTATQDLSTYIIDGALVVRFGTGRLRPFARIGAGYVRELHNDNSLVETGSAIHAGGGVTYWFSERRTRVGARADARVYFIRDGIAFGDNRTLGAGSGAIVFAF